MIQTVIQAHGMVLSRKEESQIRNQLQKSLRRFRPHIRLVNLYIKDVNGPKGGQDISVVVRTRLSGKIELAASAQRSRLLAATSSAIRKTRRQVKRAIRRQQSFDRLRFGNRPIAAQSGSGNMVPG